MTKDSFADVARRAIKSADDKFRSILEEAPIGVYQATADGRLVYANQAFLRMLGYGRTDELIAASGGELRGMYHSGDEMRAHLRIIYQPEGDHTVDVRLARADGGAFWASIQTRGIRDADNAPLYHDGFVTDITEKKALQAETMRASQLASLGELAAGVAHEINNPLNAVINFAQLLEEDLPGEPGGNDLLARIIRESNRIAVIVRNLLSFARMEHENFGPVGLDRVVADSLGLTQAQMEKEGIWVRTDIPEDLPRVRGRAQELQQVCINLLSNARHALNQKYPGQDPDKIVHIGGQALDGAVRLCFRDHGTGIPGGMLDRVLDPFFSTKPKGVGTGLGLSISRKIVESHGGSLSIESEEGRCTEIGLTLPVWREDAHG